MLGFIFACIIFGGVVRSFVGSVQKFVVPIIHYLSKVSCMQLNSVSILGSISFTVIYKVILKYLANWTDTKAYRWHKKHNKPPIPLNEWDRWSKVWLQPSYGHNKDFLGCAGSGTEQTPALLSQRRRRSYHYCLEQITDSTDWCLLWSLSLFFLFPIHTYVHVKEANSHKCLHSMVLNVIAAVAVDTCAFRYFLLLQPM